MAWLFFIVMVDAIGFGIILPLLPIFALKFHLDAFELGVLTAVFSFFQLITAPILGALSDRFGRKLIIVVCLLFIGLSYALLANSQTFLMAFLARGLAGMFTGNVSVVLASVADLSSEKNRAKYMGYIGAGTGIGFILGPVIGGFIAGDSVEEANLHLVFYIAAIFTTLAGILAMFFLKETLSVKSTKIDIHFWTKLKRVTNIIFFKKELVFLLYLSVFMWFSFTSVNVFLTTWSVEKFNISPFHLGLIGTVFALIAALVQVISPYFLSGGKAILIGFQISALSMFAMLFNPGWEVLAIIVISLATGIGILFPNLNSTISLYGSSQQRGFILGMSQSASTLGQTIGPVVIGWLYVSYSPFLGFLGIGLSFAAASLITLHYMLNNRRNLS
jgi:DHA1 family tetracycline resistance protein-like MFS transporter